VYSRVVQGKTLTFGVSGKLWNNALVMYDRETNSLWSHVSGAAIRGPLQGKRLTMLAATPRVTWAAWRRLHPNTLALSVNGRQDVAFDTYADYHADAGRTGLFAVRRPDRRAQPKEMVLGVALGPASKAYRHAFLRKRRLVSDVVGGTPVLVWFDPGSGATAVYARPAAAPEGGFRLDGDVMIASGAGDRRWQAATGKALGSGPDLKPLPHTNAYWFGWVAFYPRTTLKAA